MKRTAAFLFMLVILISGLWIPPKQAHACSCAQVPSVQTGVEQSAAVFSGKVLEIKEPSFSVMRSSADPVRVVFEVKESWKGISETQAAISTAMSSASCGYEFSAGKEYLVFANGEPGKLNVSLCSSTKELASATQDLAVLGKGQQPTEQIDLTVPWGIKYRWILWVSILIVIIGFTWYGVRRITR